MGLRALVASAVAGIALAAACGGDDFTGVGSGGTAGDAGPGGSAGQGGAAGSSACAQGAKLCNGACVSLDDPAYGCSLSQCQGCSLPHATPQCESGACSILACAKGFKDCRPGTPGCETNIGTASDCGDCDKDCAPGQVCLNGACAADCGSLTKCGRECADLTSNLSHCGKCDNPCPASIPNATPRCETGTCDFDCTAGFADCGPSEGCETDINNDPKHCGGCAKPCKTGPTDGVGEVCLNGTCGCGPGLTGCSISGGGVACVNTQTDPTRCGDCSTACLPGEMCDTSVCSIPKCAYGLKYCFSKCVSTPSDPNNCGACGNKCDKTQICIAGQCKPGSSTACGLPSMICKLSSTNLGAGCAMLESDAQHCGGCNKPCSPGQACLDGMCKKVPYAAEKWQCPNIACPIPQNWPVRPGNFFCSDVPCP